MGFVFSCVFTRGTQTLKSGLYDQCLKQPSEYYCESKSTEARIFCWIHQGADPLLIKDFIWTYFFTLIENAAARLHSHSHQILSQSSMMFWSNHRTIKGLKSSTWITPRWPESLTQNRSSFRNLCVGKLLQAIQILDCKAKELIRHQWPSRLKPTTLIWLCNPHPLNPWKQVPTCLAIMGIQSLKSVTSAGLICLNHC